MYYFADLYVVVRSAQRLFSVEYLRRYGGWNRSVYTACFGERSGSAVPVL